MPEPAAPSLTGSVPVIAATKLQIPARREGLVRRAALVELLAGNDERTLTLVSAPAGSGKTTLLAEWSADQREQRPFAWLSLDGDDNDPVRFWTFVIDALRSVDEGIGAEARGVLRAPGTSLTELVVPTLVNELLAIPDRMVLVIDDYQVISDRRIHDSLRFLVDRLPATVHLAMASRSDPALPLPRLRVRGQLTELRARDLRFTDEEARAVLTGFGLSLNDGQIARLQRRTEGWVAGIQLAGMSLRDRASPGDFIDAFTGDDRRVVDYLWSDVLAGKDPRLLRFMLRTSILEQLSASLCAVVSGDEYAREWLLELERSNLFTVPLDNARHWYRYHHLFGQLLRAELERQEPELLAELHGRAAAWFSASGSVPEAIRHALAAADAPLAAELVASHWSEFFNAGYLTTVAAWLDALPRSVVAADSRLWLARVWTAMDQGRLDETERWLERGGRVPGDDGEVSREEWLRVLRALHMFKAGDVGAARESIGALAISPGRGSLFWRTVACCARGVTAYWSGDADDASDAFEDAYRLAGDDGNDLAGLYALGYRALIGVDCRDRDEAGRILEAAADLVDGEPQLDQHFTAMIAHLARGRLLQHQGDIARAAVESARAAELARRGAGGLERAAALSLQATVQYTQGHVVESGRLIDEAKRVLAGCPDSGTAGEELARAERAVRAGEARADSAVPGAELSERELGVLQLLPSDLSFRQIGDELYVSLNTVKTHVRHIYAKLESGTRSEAVARARELGVL